MRLERLASALLALALASLVGLAAAQEVITVTPPPSDLGSVRAGQQVSLPFTAEVDAGGANEVDVYIDINYTADIVNYTRVEVLVNGTPASVTPPTVQPGRVTLNTTVVLNDTTPVNATVDVVFYFDTLKPGTAVFDYYYNFTAYLVLPPPPGGGPSRAALGSDGGTGSSTVRVLSPMVIGAVGGEVEPASATVHGVYAYVAAAAVAALVLLAVTRRH